MNEVNEEKKYLKHVLKSMVKELEVNKKDYETLIKTGQTLSFEDMKRGEHLRVNNSLAQKNNRIEALRRVYKSPYFGRMDFKHQKELDYNAIYIGKIGLHDENGSQLIVDWRAPIASMFYNDTCGKAEYEAPDGIMEGIIKLKRQIIIEDSKVKKVLDTDIVTNDEILQEYLNVHADTKMKDIIASIQKEQNDIIREPMKSNIIVQGVAGSGKTSVALHRIAYLLYNMPNNISGNQFLLIGPNTYFLDYISSVLPDLDTTPIVQKRYVDLAMEYIGEKVNVKKFKPSKNINPKTVEKLQIYKNSLDYMESIKNFMNEYINGSFINKGIEFDGVEIFNKEFIQKAISSGVLSKLNYERAKKITLSKFKENKDTIYNTLNKKYKNIYLNANNSEYEINKARNQSQELRNIIYRNGEKIIKDFYKKLDNRIINIYKMFLENGDKYLLSLSEKEKNDFHELFCIENRANISNEDLPALIYIKYLLSGNTLEYKHISVDEAQDHGMFSFSALKHICPDATFSIYGDLAQSVNPYTNINNWEDLGKQVFQNDIKLYQLNKGYRTTKEITQNSNLVLNRLGLQNAKSVNRNGIEVEFFDNLEDNNHIFEKINKLQNKEYKSIGIICKTEKEALKLYKELLKHNIKVSYLENSSTKYAGGTCIMTCQSSKGLEFDAVIIHDASSDVYNPSNKNDMHLLYVALTRALHELSIGYNGNLCNVLSNDSSSVSRKSRKRILHK